jgi:alginate O-acetyltransferase complex protein AlgI
MLFTELRFLYFFAAVFSIYWLLPGNRSRKLLLLVGSYFFYASWDWRFLSLILLSTATDYAVGLRLDASTSKRARKNWLLASMFVNLGLLGVFKYFNFFADSAVALIHQLGFTADPVFIQIILPVGISFYTFQTMSYTIDIYRRHLEPTRNLLDFSLFVAFFPQLVAGPIVRARDFIFQLAEPRQFRTVDFRWALTLFLTGFIKKACIADNLALIADPFFLNPEAYGLLQSWIAVAAYTAQIFCDFSGYTDMAIATAGMLGYKLIDNFDSPYIATSITDFWRRWHISLSTWLRDYLYISLGGNRKGAVRTYMNLMLTMLLGGLWHGAAWNFIIWGGLQGAALIFHRLYRTAMADKFRVPTLIGMMITLAFVMLAWVPFRASDLASTLQIWSQLLSWTADKPGTLIALNQPLLMAFLPALWVMHYLHGKHVTVPFWRRCSPLAFALGFGALAAMALASRATQFTPFIYFQF